MDLPPDARDLNPSDRDAVALALETLLGTVHRYWYADQPAKLWAMVKRRWAATLCFPARRLSELSLRITPTAYVRLLTAQLDAMRGKLEPSDYMAPAWAGRFLYNWLKADGERLYYEYRDRKAVAGDILQTLASNRRPPPDAVEPLAQTHRALAAVAKRRPRRGPADPFQPTLFKLS
jgi:hypothetical protein